MRRGRERGGKERVAGEVDEAGGRPPCKRGYDMKGPFMCVCVCVWEDKAY